jgi:HEAT repeat protein
VKEAAVAALDKLGWMPDRSEASARYWITKDDYEKCTVIGDPAVGPLIKALEDKDRDARSAAAAVLGKIGDARAARPLLAAIGDKDKKVAASAARALGQIGEARAVKPLIKQLMNVDLCDSAAEALGEIGDPRAVKPLIAALKGKDGIMRRAAARGLVQIYKSGKLKPEAEQLILDQRSTMISKHTDGLFGDHMDQGCKSYHCHEDWTDHVDSGIGIKFSL